MTQVTSEPQSLDTTAIYRVGTLTYTKSGLVILFAWLLWGDVCFTLMEAVPGLLPLKLKELNTPNWVMALILSTIPNILNATICPWVSFKSDRHRGKWGRRMPFILSTAPFLTLALILLGFSAPIGKWLHGLLAGGPLGMSPNTITVLLIGLFGTMFSFFNMFVASVFWYLFNDVVPEKVLSRFLAAMRIVSTGAGSFYGFFIFPFGMSHFAWIFLGGALLYFLTFTAMCLKVKEGQYPPPPAGDHTGLAGEIKTYMRECYAHGFYWHYFLSTAFGCIGGCIGMFGLLLNQHMGLTMQQMGRLSGVGGIWSLILLYLGGILADRVHPLRTLVLAQGLALLVMPVGLIWLFVTPAPSTYYHIQMALTLVTMPIYALSGISSFPTEMRIFPKERFGQFCSANAMVRSVGVLIGGQVAGFFMDLMKWVHGGDFAYRYLPAWSLFFAVIAYINLCMLYRDWQRRGGEKGYTPPGFSILPPA